jgi:PhnB protein
MALKPMPDGFHTVTPFLNVKGAAALITFLENALGAEEVLRMPGPGGMVMHAEVNIGN